MQMITGFAPIVNDECKILILGTMPGEESLRKQQYYGHIRNQFWKIMFTLFDKEFTNDYDEKKNMLLQNNVALWDVLNTCEREGSSDSNIKNSAPNDFEWLYENYPHIQRIFFNGQKSEELYRRHVIKHISNDPHLPFTILPSTSPANAIKFEEKFEKWKEIKKFLIV